MLEGNCHVTIILKIVVRMEIGMGDYSRNNDWGERERAPH